MYNYFWQYNNINKANPWSNIWLHYRVPYLASEYIIHHKYSETYRQDKNYWDIINNYLIVHGQIRKKITSNKPGKYTVIYTKRSDYCKVNTSQNKANPWSIKSLHYNSAHAYPHFKIRQE